MSLLNQLFNRSIFGSKCKTSLTLAISRMKLLQNKRDLQLRQMRTEIAQFLQAGQEAIARIRVEHVIREQNITAAYAVLELFCEFILARVPILENQKECPSEMREAIASIIFAAPRCSDLPDLLHIKNLFTAKYGKEFTMAVSELRPDSGVNRTLIEKLSVTAPSSATRLKVLKEIAQEHNLAWDSSMTEAELSKKHEDLLGGSKEICGGSSHAPTSGKQDSPKSSASNGTNPIMPNVSNLGSQQAPTSPATIPSPRSNEIQPLAINCTSDARRDITSQSSDVLERARAAIASAERASAAARAAAELANVKFGSLKLEAETSYRTH